MKANFRSIFKYEPFSTDLVEFLFTKIFKDVFIIDFTLAIMSLMSENLTIIKL